MTLIMKISVLAFLLMQGFVNGQELDLSKRESRCVRKHCQSNDIEPCFREANVKLTYRVLESRSKDRCSAYGAITVERNGRELWVRGGCSAELRICIRRQKEHCKVVKCTKEKALKSKKCVITDAIHIFKVNPLGENMRKICEKQYRVYDNMIQLTGKCSGKFVVCYKPVMPRCKGSTSAVDMECSDMGKHENKCEVSRHKVIVSAEIFSEDEKSSCVAGKNYVWAGNTLTVREGCRATFRLCLKNNDGGLNMPAFDID